MSAKTVFGLLRSPNHLVSLGGGLGLSPWAPGTFGTLPAFLIVIPLQTLLDPILGGWWIGLGILGLMWFGAMACAERTARAMALKDPGAIVCDEYLAYAGLLWFLPPLIPPAGSAWATAVWAFLLFRLFDITKPFPVSWADQRLEGGLGIMVDDVLAAAWAYAVIVILQSLHLPGGP